MTRVETGHRWWIGSLLVFAGCLAVPPAVDPQATTSGAPASQAGATSAAPIPISAREPSKSLVECPLVTGKNQMCSNGLLCTRDKDGCETCTCREDLESDGSTREPAAGMDPRDRELDSPSR